MFLQVVWFGALRLTLVFGLFFLEHKKTRCCILSGFKQFYLNSAKNCFKYECLNPKQTLHVVLVCYALMLHVCMRLCS